MPPSMRAVLADLGVAVHRGPITLVPVAALRPADSPRLAGEDAGHARTLAETDAALPPVLVHRGTMRVVDGMHRLRAAQLNGAGAIEVQFVDGSTDLAFVISVAANTAHGLPLSMADRQAAAARIIAGYPQWSDRSVAVLTGLAARTVGAVRRQLGGDQPWPGTRIGRDGRVRPLDRAAGRRAALQLITEHPEASLRQIARAAGISPGTARDVRERLRRGDDPVPSGLHPRPTRRAQPEPVFGGGEQAPSSSVRAQPEPVFGGGEHGPSSSVRAQPEPVFGGGEQAPSSSARAQPEPGFGGGGRPPNFSDVDGHGGGRRPAVAVARRRAGARDRAAILRNLKRDPSLRFTDAGRELLRWLDTRAVGAAGWERFVATIPAHSAYGVAELARGCADEWLEFAARLKDRLRAMTQPDHGRLSSGQVCK